MFDFGALPPEINSARIYAGPGLAPLTAAASAWDELAAQLESYATGYFATLSELRGQAWFGGASAAMAVAVEPYVAWATGTAELAGEAAAQARAAAAAYETAFAATVPPHVVAANRVQLATLIATNFFGQNAAAIAATEGMYAEMWAQDATAMYGYAASSSAASALTPFSPPPRTTNTQGRAAQAAAVHRAASTSADQARGVLASGLPTNSSLGSSGSPASASDVSLIDSASGFNTVITTPGQTFMAGVRTFFGWEQFGNGLDLSDIQAAKAAIGTVPVVPDIAAVRGPVAGAVDRATFVGKLTVPASWVANTPPASVTDGSVVLSDNPFRSIVATAANPGTGMGGMPPVRAAGQSTGVPVLRNGRRAFRMPRPAYGG